MYTETAITNCVKRVGWADAVPPSDIILADAVKLAESNRYVKDFSKLAIVENLVDWCPNRFYDETAFNNWLQDLKVQAVRKALAALFTYNEAANVRIGYNGFRVDISVNDYTDLITAKAPLIDDVLGYQIAIDAVDVMLTTTRLNTTVSSNTLSEERLGDSLEGAVNPNTGQFVPGLRGYLKKAIDTASALLFPATTQPPLLRDKSYVW